MLSVYQLAMQYGENILFKDVGLELLPGKRYGISGANGAGKSTFLRVIAGQESPCEGSYSFPKDKKLGLLSQDHFKYEQDSILDVVLQGNQQLWQALQKKERLLQQEHLSAEDGLQLGECEETIFNEEGYSAHAIAHELLCGLGIVQAKHHDPLSTLSGGYKLRTLLAQLLFSKPDILLLDEPTNHLDIISIRWLGQFLKSEFKGVLLFISHDRDFLNTVATHILDIDYETVTIYPGNYEKAMADKALQAELRSKTLAGQERKIAHLQSFVDRFGAKATKAKQAQSRVKQIEKIELVEIKSTSRQAPNFAFPIVRQSGKNVLSVTGISKQFNELQVLDKISFNVMRGERVALIGPNGMGKSTLLKIILNKLTAEAGSFEWGHETYPAYFAQDHHELLHEPQSALDWLTNHATQQSSNSIRNMLGRVLFSGDDALKSILSLSGGECARLLLAHIMLAAHNVLVLDEPTNHLDLESIDALADALIDYEGTLIIVSHDKYFVTKIANRVIALTPHGTRDYLGNYEAYLAYYGEDYLVAPTSHTPNSPSVAKTVAVAQPQDKQQKRLRDKWEKEITKWQGEVERLEKALHELITAFTDPSLYEPGNSKKCAELEEKKAKLQAELATATAAWEQAIIELDGV